MNEVIVEAGISTITFELSELMIIAFPISIKRISTMSHDKIISTPSLVSLISQFVKATK
jgi:hypothetical protein